MNDFQDILKLVMEAEEEDDTLPGSRPNLRNVGSRLTGTADPLEAVKTWVTAHAQEYNVLRREVYKTINLLKEVYDKLPEYDTGTVGQAMGGVRKPTAPAATMTPERQAQLAALKAAAAQKIGAYKGTNPAPTPAPTPGEAS